MNPVHVDRVIVGNEAILRGDVTVEELNAYIRQIRRELPRRIRVSTAEPLGPLEENPDLGRNVDFITINMLPYWYDVALPDAIAHVKSQMAALAAVYPGKPIVLGEAGWPSEGRTRKGSVADVPTQAAFIRAFLQAAQDQGWDYYLLEAYDQPWKISYEGAAGAYWGLFNASGQPKFELEGEISSLPQWPFLAAISIVLTVLAGIAILRIAPRIAFPGQLFIAGLAGLVVTFALAIFEAVPMTYAAWDTWLGMALVIPVASLALAIVFAEAIEMALSLWRVHRRKAEPQPFEGHPFVSIHVPCYAEPPEMVIETLNALSHLDWPHFEVVILDNNTADEALWRPVEAHARALGPRFRFFHFDGVSGFKAGALNKALEVTDPAAEFVAVIDSDYQVAPDWLAITIPHFSSEKIALVQGPQDYRDAGESLFKAMAYEEYAGFFRIGMVERNEANAIIQHGTMTIVRRAVLDRLKWAEWSITEDAELGLRLFGEGYESVYLDRTMGRGLMPDTLAAYRQQRHRWVYGAMQIMKHHAGRLFSRETGLTRAQRYHFVAGWLPWIADGLSMAFTAGAIVWSVLMAINPWVYDLPMLMSLAGIAIGLFLIKTGKTLLLYPFRVGTGLKGALYASIAGLSLSHTVGKAVWSGLLTSGQPFLRTPKCEGLATWRQVWRLAFEEIVFFALLMISIGLTWWVRGLDDRGAVIWMAALAVQALPFAAAIFMAWISARPPEAPQAAEAAAEGGSLGTVKQAA
jgi:cellulose synthase/poly-beta-1,6-N-acetylglucosamine synthase-like glycosyltransferase